MKKFYKIIANLELFQREVLVCSRLHHPNQHHDHLRSGDGKGRRLPNGHGFARGIGERSHERRSRGVFFFVVFIVRFTFLALVNALGLFGTSVAVMALVDHRIYDDKLFSFCRAYATRHCSTVLTSRDPRFGKRTLTLDRYARVRADFVRESDDKLRRKDKGKSRRHIEK